MAEKQEVQSRNDAPSAGMCYAFGILFPLFYLSLVRRDQQDRFLRFHCIQCLIVFAVLTPLIFVRSGSAKYVADVCCSLLFLGWFAAMVQAARRKTLRLPLIGYIAGRLV
jgi:uncharacterized membrane protein